MLDDGITLDTQSDTSLLLDSASTKCLCCASLYRRLCVVWIKLHHNTLIDPGFMNVCVCERQHQGDRIKVCACWSWKCLRWAVGGSMSPHYGDCRKPLNGCKSCLYIPVVMKSIILFWHFDLNPFRNASVTDLQFCAFSFTSRSVIAHSLLVVC